MSNIEELFREQLKNAETVPPDELWANIESRLATQSVSKSPAVKKRYGGRGNARFWMISSVSTLAIAGFVAAVMLFSKSDDSNQIHAISSPVVKEVVLPDDIEIQVEAVDDVLPRTTPVVATVTQKVTDDIQPEKNVSSVAESDAVITCSETTNMISEVTEDYSEDETVVVFDEPVCKETKAPVTTTQEPVRQEKQIDKAQIRKEVDRTLAVPNLITPNGDGYNDCWVISGRDMYGTFAVTIYNAQGKQVYHAANYQNDFCGAGLADGNYFYLISIPEKSYTRRGALVVRK